MRRTQAPVVGTWYMTGTGKLLLVKMLSYTGKRPDRIVIEYPEGANQVIHPQDWNELQLKVHAWVPVRQRGIFRSPQPRH